MRVRNVVAVVVLASLAGCGGRKHGQGPTAQPDVLLASRIGVSQTTNVLANDTGSIVGIVSWSDAAHGVVTYVGDGVFSYDPDPDAPVADSFTYEVVDAGGRKATGTVNVTIGNGWGETNPVVSGVSAASFATLPDGTPVAVFSTSGDFGLTVSFWATQLTAAGWSAPVEIDDGTPMAATSTRVETSGNGDILFFATDGLRVEAMSLAAASGQWWPAKVIHTGTQAVSLAAFAVAPGTDGDALAWVQDGVVWLTTRLAATGVWQTATASDLSPSRAADPSSVHAIAGASGAFVASWREPDEATGNDRTAAAIASLAAGGTWSNPVALDNGLVTAPANAAIATSAGAIAVVFEDYDVVGSSGPAIRASVLPVGAVTFDPAITIGEDPGGSSLRMISAAKGMVLFWDVTGNGITNYLGTSRLVNGAWVTNTVDPGANSHTGTLAESPNGWSAVVWADIGGPNPGAPQVTFVSTNGTAATAMLLGTSLMPAASAFTSDDRLRMFFQDGSTIRMRELAANGTLGPEQTVFTDPDQAAVTSLSPQSLGADQWLRIEVTHGYDVETWLAQAPGGAPAFLPAEKAFSGPRPASLLYQTSAGEPALTFLTPDAGAPTFTIGTVDRR